MFEENVETSTQTHTSHLDICNAVTGRVKMSCCRKSRGVVGYASQMLTNSTPETMGERIDELAGLTPRALACMRPRLLSGRAVGGVYQYVS